MNSSLAVAVLEGYKQRIFDLIFSDANIEEQNDVGNRPLHAAAFTGNVEIARLLVKAGADINAKGSKGRTPLHIAAGNDRGEGMVRYLLEECKADPQAEDDFGKTARDYASPICAIPLDQRMLAQWSSLLGLETTGNSVLAKETRQWLSSDAQSQAPGAFTVANKQAEALLKALNQLQDDEQATTMLAADVASLDLKTDKASPRISEAYASRRSNLKEYGSSTSSLSPRHDERDVIRYAELASPKSSASGSNRSPWSVYSHARIPSERSLGEVSFETPSKIGMVTTKEVEEDEEEDYRPPDDLVKKGFYVEVDGARVFVPIAIPTLIPNNTNQSTESDISDEDEEEAIELGKLAKANCADGYERENVACRPLFQTVQLTGILRSHGEGLGMQLGEDPHDFLVRVRKVKRDMPASLAGMRIGDLPVNINGKNVRGHSLEEVIEVLNETDSASITFERNLPSICFDIDSIDWRSDDDETSMRILELLAVLESPPPSIKEDEVAQLIHGFQSVITLVRRGECGSKLKRSLEKGLQAEASRNDDLAERAATIVHRALRAVESRNEADEDDDVIGLKAPQDLLRGVMRGILSS